MNNGRIEIETIIRKVFIEELAIHIVNLDKECQM